MKEWTPVAPCSSLMISTDPATTDTRTSEAPYAFSEMWGFVASM